MRLTALIAVSSIAVLVHGRTVSAQGNPVLETISQFEPAALQWALAQIESGHFKNPDLAQGSSGEVSRFQILPEVWKTYSRSKNYSDPQLAWRVAYRILKDRQEWFIRGTGRLPSAFDLYVMWNKPGLYERVRFNRHRLPRKLRDVAERFENLVSATADVTFTWN